MNTNAFLAESASTPTDADTHERSHPDLDAELSDEALEAAAGGYDIEFYRNSFI